MECNCLKIDDTINALVSLSSCAGDLAFNEGGRGQLSKNIRTNRAGIMNTCHLRVPVLLYSQEVESDLGACDKMKKLQKCGVTPCNYLRFWTKEGGGFKSLSLLPFLPSSLQSIFGIKTHPHIFVRTAPRPPSPSPT